MVFPPARPDFTGAGCVLIFFELTSNRQKRHLKHEKSRLTPLTNFTSRAGESGAEATAVQTLRAGHDHMTDAERLDCVRLTAAFARTGISSGPMATSRIQAGL
jgi:hypothetical protein